MLAGTLITLEAEQIQHWLHPFLIFFPIPLLGRQGNPSHGE